MPEEKPQDDESQAEDEEGLDKEESSEDSEETIDDESAAEEEYDDEPEEEEAYQDPNELVTIKTFVFPYQAQAAKLHMDVSNIPAFLADLETVSMDWFLGGAIGNVKLQVRRCDMPAALAALAEIKPSDTSEDETDSTVCLSCGQPIPEETTACPSCGWSYADDEETRFREG